MVHQNEKDVFHSEFILARIDGGKAVSKYQSGQIVYSQGDPAAFVFYIRAGKVRRAVVSEKGKYAVVAIHLPGNFFGEECLTGHKLRMATLTALTECKLVRLPKESVISALHDDMEFSELFTMYLLERNIRMQDDFVDQLLNSIEKRLARLLLILANGEKEDQPDTIAPGITQTILGEMIGTSRTHVNHFMNKFRQLGLIEYDADARGEIRVNRSLLNLLLHETPQIAHRN